MSARAAYSVSGERLAARDRERVLLGAGATIAAICALLTVLGQPMIAAGLVIALVGGIALLRWPESGLYAVFAGAMYFDHFNVATLPIPSDRIPFWDDVAGIPPAAILLLAAFALTIIKRAREGARPLIGGGTMLTPVALFTVVIVFGLVRGITYRDLRFPLEFQPKMAFIEVGSLIYLPVAYLFAATVITTARQVRAVVWVAFGALMLKALQGLVALIQYRGAIFSLNEIATHEDSMFLAMLVLLAVGLWFYAPRTAIRRAVLWTVPLVLVAIVANQRRSVLAALALALVACGVTLLTDRAARRIVLRVGAVGALLLAAYVAIFWNTSGPVAAPIAAARSLVAPQGARDTKSNAWRDMENYNIERTVEASPWLGIGFGRQHRFLIEQPSLDPDGFTYWRYVTHNGVYWLWIKFGAVGFALFWYMLSSALIRAVLLFRRQPPSDLRAVPLLIVGLMVLQPVFMYADIGLATGRNVVNLGIWFAALSALERLVPVGVAAAVGGYSVAGIGRRRPPPVALTPDPSPNALGEGSGVRENGEGEPPPIPSPPGHPHATLRRAMKNTAAQLVSQLVTWSATLVFTALLGRYLGDEGLGILFLGLTFSGFFGVLPIYGLQNLVTREVARRPEELARYLVYGLVITGVLWVGSFVAIEISARALGYSDLTRRVLTIYAVTMGMQAVYMFLSAIYRGLERMAAPSIAVVVERVLNMTVGVGLLMWGAGVEAMAYVFLMGATANVIVQAVPLARTLRTRIPWDYAFVLRLVRDAIPFAAYWAVWAMYWKIDVLLLSKMTDETVVGWYGAAYRFFETLLFLPNVVAAAVMLPILARLSQGSREGMKQAFEKGLTLLLVVGMPICAAMLVLSGKIIAFIYGSGGFTESVPVLQVLGVGVLVLYVNAAMSWALVSLNLERRFMFVPLVALVINVGLNLVMIPLWRHVGAAAATVITEALVGGAYLVMLPKWLLHRGSLDTAIRAALAATGMAVALLLLRERLPLLLLVPIGGVVYVALALLLRAVPPDDLRAMRAATGRFKVPRSMFHVPR